VILSFLKRERLPLYVPKRYCVPARTFLGVPDRLHNRFWTVIKCLKTLMKRSGTVRNVQERSVQERWTLNGKERLGTFESEYNNVSERIVENVHGTFTLQERKNHFMILVPFLQTVRNVERLETKSGKCSWHVFRKQKVQLLHSIILNKKYSQTSVNYFTLWKKLSFLSIWHASRTGVLKDASRSFIFLTKLAIGKVKIL
jgi:hypothetical protein